MILQQIKKIKNLTFQEQEIADYILINPECILENNAKELAKLTFTSSSTVVRFCKKLGYEGYPNFQLQYTKEHVSNIQYKNHLVTKDMLVKDVIDVVDNLYHYIVEETKQMLSKETLVRIVNYMLQAKKIDFYASDINYSRIQSMCLKLNTINIQAQAYNALNQSYLRSVNPKECLSFVVSHSGKNQSMIDIAYALRKHNVTTIALTSNIEPALELVCNESLYMFSTDDELHAIQYGLSLEYILDVLYSCLIVKKGIVL
ncbi:MAG: MurR/RpiR family transcriptional regulator [Coprobacillaceae bacterium]